MEQARKKLTFKFANPQPTILIIEGRFYEDINDLLIQGARDELERAGAAYDVCSVSGALEIPTAVALSAASGRYDGFVALGCVLKGGTHHDQIVGMESARALQDLGTRHGLPIGNGILTCNTREQATERADPAKMDRGGAAAEACLRLVELRRKWETMCGDASCSHEHGHDHNHNHHQHRHGHG